MLLQHTLLQTALDHGQGLPFQPPHLCWLQVTNCTGTGVGARFLWNTLLPGYKAIVKFRSTGTEDQQDIIYEILAYSASQHPVFFRSWLVEKIIKVTAYMCLSCAVFLAGLNDRWCAG